MRGTRYLFELLLVTAVVLMTSCGQEAPGNDEPPTRVVRQPIVDTDADGLDDDWETDNFGDLSQGANGDPDADDMTNLEEYENDLDPNVKDAFDDTDGDRYPNIYEVRGGADPHDAGSTPAPTYVVAASGGTHTTVSGAISAANVANGAYQIIGIAPGTYTGDSNLNLVDLASSKPKFLMIGLEGASKTIIDGESIRDGWDIYNAAVVSSLTFRRTKVSLWIGAPSSQVRIVDVLVRDGMSTSYATGVHVNAASKVEIVGSTFLDNKGNANLANQIWIGSGTAKLTNTVVWGATSSVPMLAKASGATVVTDYSLVKGQTLTGTGNLPGSTDPKLRFDGHLRWDSPLRSAGGAIAQSRIDMDGEVRPSSSPDIGVDQFVDSDVDDLADVWELAETGNLTTLTGRTQDADSDGLDNDQEYVSGTKPTVVDTDGDGVSDGAEVNTHATDPLKVDTDGDDMPDGWELAYGLDALVANGFDDADGDRYPNVFEYARGSAPNDATSIPTPNYTVNAAGGGTHTTVSSAISAANVANGAYQIIGIAPGTYTGDSNLNLVDLASSKPKFLMIGLEGASKTIIDGESIRDGWDIYNAAVVSSLTFRRTKVSLWIGAPSSQVRIVDVLVRDGMSTSYATGVHVNAASKVEIVGSTFLDNKGNANLANQIWIGSGTSKLTNTVVWGSTSSVPMLAKASGATVVTDYSLVKGQTLTGTGNLPGSTDPKLRFDGHLRWDSPLRSAGGAIVQSRIDMDGEVRPSSSPDIGVDQFVDSDVDDLADVWELAETGNLTTLTGRTQDADSDGLDNDQEYVSGTKPTVVDTDGDGVSDGAEVNTHATDPLKVDTDGDDMPDGWELAYGLDALVANGFDDADGDRYPNVFEYARGSAPNDATSIPTPNYTVNAAGGGTHTTVSSAISAASLTNGAYQIIGIAPGTYTGDSNLSLVDLASSKPKFLMIGLEGASKTIIDGESIRDGWDIYNAAVVSSLTFRRTKVSLWIGAPSSQVRIVDVLVRDGMSTTYATGVHVNAASKVEIVSSTFLDNKGNANLANQIWIGSGTAKLMNTVVWGATSSVPMLAKASGATVVTDYSLVKGQTLTGTGNLPGSTDPKFRPRGSPHLRADSPLRAAGGSATASSRVDFDGEPRPSSAPDIGVDQYVDADADGLPDEWEFEYAGGLATFSGGQDPDGDGLLNEDEALLGADPLDPDTDRDGVTDGAEFAFGTNPVVSDADELGADYNGDGVIDALNVQIGGYSGQSDTDGDGYSNASELLACTDVLRPDTDGDGYDDDVDAFPLDPLLHTLPTDGGDVTGPLITLTAPWYAVAE